MQRNIVDPKGYVEGVISDLNDQKDDLREDMDQTEDDISTARADYNQAVADYGADSPEAAEAKAVLDNYITVYENQVKQMGDLTQRITYYRWSLASQEDRQIPYIDAGLIDFPTTPPRITAELRGENLGEWFEQICKENRFGWDMVLSDSIITFVFVIGGDKSSTVIFSPEFDNLKTSSYKDNTVGYMNAGIVFGEGDGFHRKFAAVGLSTGYSRYEAAIEADISTDVETGTISTNEYNDMLCQYGKSELINHMDQTSFSGELDTDGIFKIGVDFNMGDKVTVQNEVGISATTRLIEIIYSDEASGHKVTGVFEEWED
jgi:outer membrane murein-binding lipoprotein Lpp